MKRTDIIDEVLGNDFGQGVGDVEAPCGYWIYGEVEGTVYAVRIDNDGFKYLAEFDGWVEADGHREEVSDAWLAWELGSDDVEESEAPSDMDFSDLS